MHRVDDFHGQAGGSTEILLLVDSTFRRDEIRDKLIERDYQVEIPCDPAQALEYLAAGQAPRAVLCDNLEPTLHLANLREGLSSLEGGERIPLVLVHGIEWFSPRTPIGPVPWEQ